MVTEQVNLPTAKAYPPTIKEKKKKRKKEVGTLQLKIHTTNLPTRRSYFER